MKNFSKFLSTLLVVGVILPGVVQANPMVDEGVAKRLSGNTRVETAVAASKEVYRDGSDAVILVGFNGEVDALTGTLLASGKDAPLLLTTKDKLSPTTETEIKRLKAKTIYILGGENVVSKSIEDKLKNDYIVERINGSNRYETAANVAKKVKGTSASHVFLALGKEAIEGDALSDALAIGPVSGKENMPVLLTQKDKLPKETKQALEHLKVDSVTILGGSAAISKNVEEELKDYKIKRLSGNDRFETALGIAKEYFKDPKSVVLAYGWKSADGLVGGYVGAKNKAPILLVGKDKLDTKVETYIKDNAKDAFVLGGRSVISDLVFKKVEVAIKSVDPNKPSEPANPNDPTKPEEPTKPTEPTNPIDPIVASKDAFNKAASAVKEVKVNGKKIADVSYRPYEATITLLNSDNLKTNSVAIFKTLEDLGVKKVTSDGKKWFDVKPENVSDIIDSSNKVIGSQDVSVSYTAKIQPTGQVEFTQELKVKFILKD